MFICSLFSKATFKIFILQVDSEILNGMTLRAVLHPDTQADLSLRWMFMFKNTFSYIVAQMLLRGLEYKCRYQEMLQSRSTAFPRHENKKMKLGTNNDKTNIRRKPSETDWGRSPVVLGVTHGRAIKEGSKVNNIFLVNNFACSLPQNGHVVTYLLVASDKRF